jgi:beta-galactosidase
LLKMKAGGITVVSTYVFWIHQEEEQGKFDWTGQRSLRDFLLLCQDLGLKVFVRMGPWCHGEVRNGGLPDWVQHSGAKLRTADPAFLDLVRPLYEEEAKQMKGLLWKDGGPVIGIQVDNENGNAPYLRALKDMARSVGVDVPYYAMTGWDIKVLDKGLLPLFGAYADGFWGGPLEKYRRDFMFTDVRASNNLGAQMDDKSPYNSKNIAQFPFLCVEIGPGMMSSYTKRIKVDPDAVTAMSLVKMGEGSNMPGYYMYQGGMNPEGKLSTLEESHPNPMPLKDYDFQTALGACGQVREQFHLLLEQHLFLQDFGVGLARMPAFFPDQRPASVKDFDTLRWAVRSDGTSGFLFYSNEQPYIPLPEHKDVQFNLKTGAGPLLVPREPITIPSGGYGIWPINLDCDGVKLDYATAQPLCRVDAGGGLVVYFFTALDGIVPELAFPAKETNLTPLAGTEMAGGAVRAMTVNSNAAVRIAKPGGGSVMFVVLTPEQSRRVWRTTFAGQDRLIMSDATVLTDGTTLRLQSDNPKDFAMSIFPAVPSVKVGDAAVTGTADWIFTRFTLGAADQSPALDVAVSQEHPAGPAATTLTGTTEATWNDAAIYKLEIPAAAAGRQVTLNIHYIGDAARIYIGDKLYDDNFYNGDAFAIALWRIPEDQWPNIRLKVLPYSEGLNARLPAFAQQKVADAKAASALDQVKATTSDQREVRVTPN